ncbi:MAG TPA: hypothetical protein VFM05_11250, partial [Candidatus Saccharimonadales bacterium]|nr:hypothetical protein [Candidatus Saccharimonadales bacterium]
MLRTSRDPDEKPTFALSRIFIPLAAYLGIFVLFFWGIHGGVGQYWDWSFPYFSDHLDTWFASKSSSWTNTNMGSPLGYASDYFLRFLVSMFSFLPPEI